MKKLFALVLALVMALSLVACGDKKDDSGDVTAEHTDTTTVAVGAVILARDDVSSDDVYKFVADIFDNAASLTTSHAKYGELSLEYGASITSVPYHPGAAKYFAEKGFEVASVKDGAGETDSRNLRFVTGGESGTYYAFGSVIAQHATNNAGINVVGLVGNGSQANVEDLTIAELQAMPYDMTDASAEEAPNSVLNSNNTNRTTERRENTVLNYDPEADHIPTLREYLEALGDDDIVQFIEIKSYNPDIVTPFKALVEELDMTDRVCVITFNDGVDHWGDGSKDEAHDVMARMAEEWPEMSLGYLGCGEYNWGDLNAVEEEQGIGAAVGQLYSYLQPYNSTCNDYNAMMFRNVIFAARHRGLTSWAWTYNTEELFAQDYLFGGTYSMTTNFSTWATNLPVRVVAEDMTVSNGDAFACTVLAQNDEVLSGCKLSLVSISGVPVSLDENGNIVATEAGEAVVMVRLDNTLDINGWDLSSLSSTDYAIYSTPITITVK